MTHYSHVDYPGMSVGMLDGKPPSPEMWEAMRAVYEALNSASMKEIRNGQIEHQSTEGAAGLDIRRPGA